MSDTPRTGPGLASLLHLCDSLFPTGGYAHSDGLEAATAEGAVTGADDLRSWMTTLLDDTLGATEGPAVARAWQAYVDARWAELRALDDELHALRPSSTAREASRAIGTRVLKTWARVGAAAGDAGVGRLLAVAPAWTLPVAFAAAAASTGADARASVEAFMYTRLAATTSAAMRLMRLGQVEAHTILGESVGRIPPVAERVLSAPALPAAFTPLLDIATMRQQYVTTRLFRS